MEESLNVDIVKSEKNKIACKKYYKNNRDKILKQKRDKPHGYNSWCKMRQRCTNSNRDDYKHYGAKGIKVCKEWNSFEIFIKDMGYPPSKKHTLERINNFKGYFPWNCKWATRMDQMQNTRTTSRIKFNGKKQSLSMWARELKIPMSTLYSRLNRSKMSVEEAFTK